MMYESQPDAFSYASHNARKIAEIEEELNTYLLTNPINKLLQAVKDMNTQLSVLQYQVKELKGIKTDENSNN